MVDTIFNGQRVSYYLLDPIRATFIGPNEHATDGYRIFENVSYPCLTTTGGHRVELREGIWNGSGYSHNIELINVPVFKHHDTGGSEMTASLKHFYGVLSMTVTMDETKMVAREIVIAPPSVVFSPHEGTVGTKVAVSGSGFGPNTGKILVGGTPTKVLGWNNTAILSMVNKPISSGRFHVSIRIHPCR